MYTIVLVRPALRLLEMDEDAGQAGARTTPAHGTALHLGSVAFLSTDEDENDVAKTNALACQQNVALLGDCDWLEEWAKRRSRTGCAAPELCTPA